MERECSDLWKWQWLPGMPENEIYKKALALNSYWFPQTYTELAVFLRPRKISIEECRPQRDFGESYSSGRGYGAVSQQLQNEGLTPQVKS